MPFETIHPNTVYGLAVAIIALVIWLTLLFTAWRSHWQKQFAAGIHLIGIALLCVVIVSLVWRGVSEMRAATALREAEAREQAAVAAAEKAAQDAQRLEALKVKAMTHFSPLPVKGSLPLELLVVHKLGPERQRRVMAAVDALAIHSPAALEALAKGSRAEALKVFRQRLEMLGSEAREMDARVGARWPRATAEQRHARILAEAKIHDAVAKPVSALTATLRHLLALHELDDEALPLMDALLHWDATDRYTLSLKAWFWQQHDNSLEKTEAFIAYTALAEACDNMVADYYSSAAGIWLGDFHRDNGDIDKAVDAYTRGTSARRSADDFAFYKNWPEAISLYRLHILMQKRVIAIKPEWWKWRRQLYLTQSSLSEVYLKTGNMAEAEKWDRETYALNRRIATEFPQELMERHNAAISLGNLAKYHRQRGELKQAVAVLERRIAEAKQLVAEEPKERLWRFNVYGGYVLLSRHYKATKESEKEAQAYRTLIAVCHEFIANDPTNGDWPIRLAENTYYAGTVTTDAGRQKQRYREALRMVEDFETQFDRRYARDSGWMKGLLLALGEGDENDNDNEKSGQNVENSVEK